MGDADPLERIAVARRSDRGARLPLDPLDLDERIGAELGSGVGVEVAIGHDARILSSEPSPARAISYSPIVAAIAAFRESLAIGM